MSKRVVGSGESAQSGGQGRKKARDQQEEEVATEVASGGALLRNEAELLAQSNLLRLQTEELVKEVKKERSKIVDKAFEELKDLLLTRTAYPEDVSTAFLSEHGIIGLHLDNYDNDDCRLTFAPPEAVYLAGSYALGTCASPEIIADVLVQMPSAYYEDRFLHRDAI
jgi:hypothetical protein